jgi:hypothetical protein
MKTLASAAEQANWASTCRATYMGEDKAYSFSYSDNLALEFKKLLKRHEIAVESGSKLDQELDSVLYVILTDLDPQAGESLSQERLRSLMGIHDLVSKIVAVKESEDFEELVPHLRKLNKCAVLQNQRSSVLDQEANKVIELYWATVCMRIGSDVRVDDPDSSSKGANPDVLVTINGARWGFACKTLHSPKGRTLRDNLVSAIEQINCSEAEIGIPVINLKNVVDHERIWPSGVSFPSLQFPLTGVDSFGHSLVAALLDEVGVAEVCDLFKGSKVVPGCLLFMQSARALTEGLCYHLWRQY